MESQCKQLKAYFNGGRSITQLEASKSMGIGRLASRIFDLKKQGYPIGSRFVYATKANGKLAKVKSYYNEEAIIKKHLDSGRSITELEAFFMYDIERLALRIYGLISKGYPISSEFITVKKANGKNARVKKYFKTRTKSK